MHNNSSLREDHELIRNKVGFYDFTLETLVVAGPDARAFLDFVFVNDVGHLPVGKAVYTTMLDERGLALDDVIIFARAEQEFWVTTAKIEQLKKWLGQHRGERNVEFTDITDQKAIYSIQGPLSIDVVNQLLVDTVTELSPFEFKDTRTHGGIEVMVSRTGFSGERGYELHYHPNQQSDLAAEIQKTGSEHGIREITADEVTLASIPIEKGFIQETEFLGLNTVELGLGWTVKKSKTNSYIGRELTDRLKAEGPKRKLLGFTVPNESAHVTAGDKVLANGREVGSVTAFTYGFTAEKYIGYAIISDLAVGDDVVIHTQNGPVETTLTPKEFLLTQPTA